MSYSSQLATAVEDLSRETRPGTRTPHLFFLMIRPPPSSTLSPYTTLFRSRRRTAPPARRRVPRGTPGRRGGTRAGRGDRKSTRLNSSHMSTSYAGCCVKKKKHPDGLRPPARDRRRGAEERGPVGGGDGRTR